VSSKPVAGGSTEDGAPTVRRDTTVEVNGKRFAVTTWLPEGQVVSGGAKPAAPRPKRSSGGAAAAAGSGTITIPMQGTIVKVMVAEGDAIEEGATICVLEAMKMENAITADKTGTVKKLSVETGQSVSSGDIAAIIE